LSKFPRIRRHTQNHCSGRFQGAQDAGKLAFEYGAYNYKIVVRRFVVIPEIAGQDGDPWGLPFCLPAGRQEACEFQFIGQN
jgi:hypothetical protein